MLLDRYDLARFGTTSLTGRAERVRKFAYPAGSTFAPAHQSPVPNSRRVSLEGQLSFRAIDVQHADEARLRHAARLGHAQIRQLQQVTDPAPILALRASGYAVDAAHHGRGPALNLGELPGLVRGQRFPASPLQVEYAKIDAIMGRGVHRSQQVVNTCSSSAVSRALSPMSIRVALNHRTRYEYDRPAQLGPQVVRLFRACTRTPLLSYSLRIEPERTS